MTEQLAISLDEPPIAGSLHALVSRLVPEGDLYYELLYEVEMKHPGETRHQTARRLIRQAQSHPETNQGVNVRGEPRVNREKAGTVSRGYRSGRDRLTSTSSSARVFKSSVEG